MAQGTVTVFDEILPTLNFANSALTSTAAGVSMDTDSFKIALISNDIDTLPASTATPNYGTTFTEVSGTSYTAGGNAATITVSEAGGMLTIALASDVTFTTTGAGEPNDIRCAVLYSTTHTGSIDTVLIIDMTTDSGTTPLDLNAGEIVISAGNFFTIA